MSKKRRVVRTEDDAEVELYERGWVPTNPPGMWKHENLATLWPVVDALRLQDEADAGMQDQVHRMLRGQR